MHEIVQIRGVLPLQQGLQLGREKLLQFHALNVRLALCRVRIRMDQSAGLNRQE